MKAAPQRPKPRAIDLTQELIVRYASALQYSDIPRVVVDEAKLRIIDTLGVLTAGFRYEPCRRQRDLAAAMPQHDGATIIGTRIKTAPDMAAFVNGTTARYIEGNDVYARYRPGASHGHPSDVIAPLLAAAEHGNASGKQFITAVVAAYEIYLRLCNVFHNAGFDPSTFGGIATAAGAGSLLGLTPPQLAHCISLAAVPNNILRQVRLSHVSMWKALAAGHAGRSGLFAALLARAGMEGPHLPFEGKAGWNLNVAREDIALDELKSASFLLPDTRIKPRPVRALTISSILAAEKIKLGRESLKNIRRVVVEVHQQAKHGTEAHHWHPENRETADHSIPYVVAAALIDGTVSPRSFDDVRLWNAELRELMAKVEILANDDYTHAFQDLPQAYRSRVTVEMLDGEQRSEQSGGDADDLATPKSEAQVIAKFRGMAEDVMPERQIAAILAKLQQLPELTDVAELPAAFVIA